MVAVDVLIPTYSRPNALAVTLTSLCGQRFKDFRVTISDQTETYNPFTYPEVLAALRLLQPLGHEVETQKHLPRRGMAEQRQFLLDQAQAPYCLFLDDDLILESDVIERMYQALRQEGCGFVGCAPIGLSYVNEIRPHEQAIEFWEDKVQAELVRPNTPEWNRHMLHNAANILHLQEQFGLNSQNQRKYKLAWVGGCVLFDTVKLREAGGFAFWEQLPHEHCGEDVLAQLRVMARHGGCGLLPSGVYHLELPTTVPDRTYNAPQVINII